MKVYTVTVGSYSDARVEGIFSTIEKAAKYAEISDGYVEEYELDNIQVADGVVYKCVKDIGSSHVDITHYEDVDNRGFSINNVTGGIWFENDYLTVYVIADGKESAKKKACDLFTEHEALYKLI